MEQQHQTTTPGSIWESNKMLIKGFLIGFFILIMLVPVAYIMSLVQERKQRQQEVVGEISSKWASKQNIIGPVIAVPYTLQPYVPGVEIDRVYYMYILPEQLSINGKMLPEVRHRSLYDVSLYRSDLTFSGVFDPAAIQKLGVQPGNIIWSDCMLMMGIDDTRGLEENITVNWNGTTHALEAGVRTGDSVIESGLSTKLALDAENKTAFTIHMKLKGSEYLYFTPVGKTTEVSLSSPWKTPAFDGQFLPSQTAEISDKGFSAKWKVLQVSRSYPQVWKETAKFDIKKSAFGVRLVQPADNYAKTERSVKYALLIIALTFVVFFFIEIMQKKQVHPLQYILVGIALCVFYTLLLSISEYTGFDPAYLIAASATVALIGLYVWSIFKKLAIAAGFTTALTGLYTYIFILIQLEDYALLYGSIGLFVILAVIMYYSRKVDWYGANKLMPSNHN